MSALHLTQSRFYSPEFNTAVFDGPIRIYFAQHQETMALEVYCRLQEYLKDVQGRLRDMFRANGLTVFILLYPSTDSFEKSFGCDVSGQACKAAELGTNFVVGVPGPLPLDRHIEVFKTVKTILQTRSMSPDFLSSQPPPAWPRPLP
jgi:hypothetical protein